MDVAFYNNLFLIDVRDFDALKAVVDDGVAQLGRLDIILTGVWHAAKVAIPHIKAGERGGSIAFTSSVGGVNGLTNTGHYGAGKHGVVGLIRTLALELAPDMIRVNTVHPTQCNTPMLMNDAMYKLFVPGSENPTKEEFAAVSQELNALPIPWVEPVDVSNALLFWASDEGRYITGATLPVDAGAIIK